MRGRRGDEATNWQRDEETWRRGEIKQCYSVRNSAFA
jgi:hypothetical protein